MSKRYLNPENPAPTATTAAATASDPNAAATVPSVAPPVSANAIEGKKLVAANLKKNAPAPTVFLAYDELALHAPRPHEFMVNGRKQLFVFKDYSTAVEVPMDVAVRLAGIEGFRVTDKAGNEFKIAQHNNEPVVLKPGELIATYDELSYTALTNRAKRAGGVITGKPKQEELIAFLMSAGNKSTPAAAASDAEGDSELDIEEDED